MLALGDLTEATPHANEALSIADKTARAQLLATRQRRRRNRRDRNARSRGLCALDTHFDSLHLKASIALLVALIVFGVGLYDRSIQIGRLEGPSLRDLELSSSP